MTHLWVMPVTGSRVRIGLDALGVETSGTVARLALEAVGSGVRRGEPLGSLEAAKFVGPVAAPLSGQLVATNDAVVLDPGLIDRDPYGEGWLAEIEASDLAAERTLLVEGPDRIAEWFAREVEDYRLKGVIAE
jgi:glycine cleavage system H protein